MTGTMTALRREPGTALHRQLFMVLRDQITRGLYSPGDLLPNEDELCSLFGVSRITVRRAVSDLERLGLVEKQPGRGTFVRLDSRVARPAATLGMIESLSKQARDTEVRVLRVETVRAPPAIATQLQLRTTDRAVHASRLRSAQGTPLMVTDAWVPEQIGKHVTAAVLKKRALFEILLAEGIRFGRVVQEVTAVAADPYHAGLLQTDVGAPLLRLTRLIYDLDRKPVQHLTVHVTSERSRILMDVSAEAINTLGAGHIVHDLLDGDAKTSRKARPAGRRKGGRND
jgi:GntR family transcriptional regulator